MKRPVVMNVGKAELGLIAQGSAVLGSGGGGNPYIGRLMVQRSSGPPVRYRSSSWMRWPMTT